MAPTAQIPVKGLSGIFGIYRYCSALPPLFLSACHDQRAPPVCVQWGDRDRRREKVGMEGPLLPTRDSPRIRIVE
ncbi:hypothetical protein J6590_087019 [Homalodisca vitripennis]|nr:hypothetical protein J6590_087019 [Homalodisca vitripennis]